MKNSTKKKIPVSNDKHYVETRVESALDGANLIITL